MPQPSTAPSTYSWRNEVVLQTATLTRHSNKIHQFFGLSPTASPTNSSRRSLPPDDDDMTRQKGQRGSAASWAASLKLRARQNPTLRHTKQRTARFLSALVQSITPIWFTPACSLAILGLTLRLLPSAEGPSGPRIWFPALVPLSTALYLAALAFFAAASALFLLRLALYPRRTGRAALAERDASGLELGYLAAWPAAWSLLVALGGYAAAEGRVGAEQPSRAFVLVVYAAWWAGAVWSVATYLFVLGLLLSARVRSTSRTAGGRFAPLVGMLVCVSGMATVALVGGLLASLRMSPKEGWSGTGATGQPILSPALVAPVVLFSFCAVGAALFTAEFNYAVLLHELILVTGWPPPEQTAAVFSMVMPQAQCAAAVLVLGDAAFQRDGLRVVAAGNSGHAGGGGDGAVVNGTILIAGLATMEPLELVCVVLALLMGGMAVVWLLVALYALFYRMARRELAWNPSWNGIVAPMATLAILSILLGMKLDSPFFRIAACVFIVLAALILVVNFGFAARLAVTAKSGRELTATGDSGGNGVVDRPEV